MKVPVLYVPWMWKLVSVQLLPALSWLLDVHCKLSHISKLLFVSLFVTKETKRDDKARRFTVPGLPVGLRYILVGHGMLKKILPPPPTSCSIHFA